MNAPNNFWYLKTINEIHHKLTVKSTHHSRKHVQDNAHNSNIYLNATKTMSECVRLGQFVQTKILVFL